jgi:threonylcarbamoyladenosine tRNA methylthiotransferase MtaB
VAQSKKFVPHFHIPLQSGSNEILHRMRRKYQRELYEERVNIIKELMPHCCIGVDVITGFPGESEAHFLETYNFINGLNISYLHVFPYSERPNTTARKLDEKVPVKTRMERAAMLRILSEKKRQLFYSENIGKTYTVLYEAEEDQGKMYGFTENYIKIEAPYDPLLINELVSVQLLEINENRNVTALELSTCLHE